MAACASFCHPCFLLLLLVVVVVCSPINHSESLSLSSSSSRCRCRLFAITHSASLSLSASSLLSLSLSLASRVDFVLIRRLPSLPQSDAEPLRSSWWTSARSGLRCCVFAHFHKTFLTSFILTLIWPRYFMLCLPYFRVFESGLLSIFPIR